MIKFFVEQFINRQISPSEVGLLLTKDNREKLQVSWVILIYSR